MPSGRVRQRRMRARELEGLKPQVGRQRWAAALARPRLRPRPTTPLGLSAAPPSQTFVVCLWTEMYDPNWVASFWLNGHKHPIGSRPCPIIASFRSHRKPLQDLGVAHRRFTRYGPLPKLAEINWCLLHLGPTFGRPIPKIKYQTSRGGFNSFCIYVLSWVRAHMYH